MASFGMGKKERQQRLLDLVRIKRISSQHDLLDELMAIGIQANQASVSRDLNELGIAKVQGIYCVPQVRSGDSFVTDFLDIDTAGAHLMVIKTSSGKAVAVASIIDNLKLSEVVGTVAGDDTIFVVTKGAAQQKIVMQKIMQCLKR